MKKIIIFLSTLSCALLASDQKQSEKQELITKHEALLARHFPKGIQSLALGATVKNAILKHTGQVQAVAARDRQLVITACHDKTIRLWDITDLTNTKLISRIDCMTPVNSIALSPDRQNVAYASTNGSTGTYGITVPRVPVWQGSVPTYGSDSANCVACSPDGQFLLQGSTNNNAYVIDPRSIIMNIVARLPHAHYVNGGTFSADNRHVITACEDKTVSVWDIQNLPQTTKIHTVIAHTGAVNTVAYAPHQNYFLTGSDDKIAKLWDMHDPKNPVELSQLRGHTHAVTCVKFSNCGTYALTASKDGTVRLWAVEDSQNPVHLGTLNENDTSIFSADFGPEAQFVIAGTYENRARIWDLSSSWIINDLTSAQISFLVKLLSKSDEITAETEALFKTLPEKLQQYIHKLRMLREKFPRELTDIITGYVGSSFALNPQASAAQQSSGCVIS